MRTMIGDIQHFSLGDGDGIRTTVFFKGCNLRCPWCHNPEYIDDCVQTLRYPDGDRKIVGQVCDQQSVLDELLEDTAFYRKSSGGVTFSGGEPMLQTRFLARLLPVLKRFDIDVVIDTAGCVPYLAFRELEAFCPHYFYDLKASDQEGYAVCGGDFKLVYGNLTRLVAEGARVSARIPIVPDFNDTEAYQKELARRLAGAGVKDAYLLPFHRLATSKYKALGRRYAYADTPSLDPYALEKNVGLYAAAGVRAKIEY